MKYILTIYDDKKFESGDKIRMFPVKRVELTKLELKFIYEDTTSFTVKDKIWEILNNENN